MAVANLALYLAGWDVRGQDPNLGGALAVCVVLGAAAIGMWRAQYWAVLGFEVLLGVLLVFAALSLMLASNVQGALLSLAVIVARRAAVLVPDPGHGADPDARAIRDAGASR